MAGALVRSLRMLGAQRTAGFEVAGRSGCCSPASRPTAPTGRRAACRCAFIHTHRPGSLCSASGPVVCDDQGGGAGVAHRAGGQGSLPHLLKPQERVGIAAPCAVVEEHAFGAPAQAHVWLRRDGERMAQARIHPAHAGPAEVDHDFARQLLEQELSLPGPRFFSQRTRPFFPPRHARSVRVGGMAGIQHGPAGTDVLGADKDHTHIRLGSWVWVRFRVEGSQWLPASGKRASNCGTGARPPCGWLGTRSAGGRRARGPPGARCRSIRGNPRGTAAPSAAVAVRFCCTLFFPKPPRHCTWCGAAAQARARCPGGAGFSWMFSVPANTRNSTTPM